MVRSHGSRGTSSALGSPPLSRNPKDRGTRTVRILSHDEQITTPAEQPAYQNPSHTASRATDWRLLFDESTLGFALFLALASISAWGLITFTSMSWIDREFITEYESLRSVGFLGTLLLFGIGCSYLAPIFKVNTTGASTALWTAGYAIILAQSFSGLHHKALFACASICLGISHALSFIVWQRIFYACDPRLADRRIVVGSALGSIVYLAASLISSLPLYVVIIALLIAGNAWALRRCSKNLFRRDPIREPLVIDGGSRHVVRNYVSSAWRYALCVSAIGYVSGVSRLIVRTSGDETLMLNVILAAGMLISCIILLILWEGMHLTFTFKAAYLVIFFLMATGLIFLPFLGSQYYAVFAGLANLSFTMVSMFMMITCLRLSHLRGIDPVGTFGLFAFVVYAGVLVGRLVGASLFGDAFNVSQILLISLISVYILSFSGAIMGLVRNTAKHDSFDPLSPVGLSEEREPAHRNDRAGRASNDTTGEPNGAEMVPDMLKQVVVVRDVIPSCCQSIKQAYQLSNREEDVLELIVRGRDTAHIAEALFVSENTVKSHCKNIYKKLDVHNRQEIFDLVETFVSTESENGTQ